MTREESFKAMPDILAWNLHHRYGFNPATYQLTEATQTGIMDLRFFAVLHERVQQVVDLIKPLVNERTGSKGRACSVVLDVDV